MAGFKIDTKLAPILTLLIVAVLAFFRLQVIGNTFFIIDGLYAQHPRLEIKDVYRIYSLRSFEHLDLVHFHTVYFDVVFNPKQYIYAFRL